MSNKRKEYKRLHIQKQRETSDYKEKEAKAMRDKYGEDKEASRQKARI